VREQKCTLLAGLRGGEARGYERKKKTDSVVEIIRLVNEKERGIRSLKKKKEQRTKERNGGDLERTKGEVRTKIKGRAERRGQRGLIEKKGSLCGCAQLPRGEKRTKTS